MSPKSRKPKYRANGKKIELHHADGSVDIVARLTSAKLADAGAKFWSRLPSTNPTVAEAVEAWMAAYVNSELNSAHTAVEYRQMMEKYILPIIGGRSARRLAPYEVRLLRRRLTDVGVPTKRLTVAIRTLSAFCGKAKAWGLMKTNPAVDLDVPGIGLPPKAMQS